MFNPLTIAQETELRGLIHKHGLQLVETKILANAQNCLVLEPAQEKSGCGHTRLGGLPDVPDGWKWPPGLEFIGQINLAKTTPHDQNDLLPKRGVLSFFLDDMGSDWEVPGLPCRVFHFDDSAGELKPASAPRGYLPRGLAASPPYLYLNTAMLLRSTISVPSSYTRFWSDMYESEGFNNEMDDAYSALRRELKGNANATWHQLLGHHGFIDGDADERAWEDVVNVPLQLRHTNVSEAEKNDVLAEFERNISLYQSAMLEATTPELAQIQARNVKYHEKKRDDYLAYLADKDRKDAELDEWVLLFQIDTDNEVGTQFNDAGIAYFLIRKADLAAQRFDRVYASLWSG